MWRLLGVLALTACGGVSNRDGVPCSGERLPITCDCVVSCVATRDDVQVTYFDDEGCSPLCRGEGGVLLFTVVK